MQGIIVQVSYLRWGPPETCRFREASLLLWASRATVHAHPGIHGGPRKAILLVAAEVIDELTARGYPLFYGALGENLTTRGIDLRRLRIGDRLRAGGALLEITQPRGPCSALDVYGARSRAKSTMRG